MIAKSNIQGDSVQPSSWGRIQEFENRPAEPPQFLDKLPKQPPVWTRNIESVVVAENKTFHLEGFVEPRGGEIYRYFCILVVMLMLILLITQTRHLALPGLKMESFYKWVSYLK